MGGNARHIDNAAASPAAHCGAELLCGEERAADEIEVEIRAPISGIDFLEGPLGGHGHGGIVAAGGADENGGRAERPRDGLVSLREAGGIESVRDEECRRASGLADASRASLATVRVAAEDGHESAGAREAFGQRAAKDAGAADDDGDFTGKIEESGRAGGGFRIHESESLGPGVRMCQGSLTLTA